MALNDYQPRRISRNNSRKISVPEETVHLSSERDERHTQVEPVNIPVSSKPQPSSFDASDLVKRLTNMVVLVEIAQAKIDVCEVMMRKSPAESDVEYTSIRLPHMKVKSGNCEAIQRGNIRAVIPVANNTELFNWVFDLNEFNVCYRKADVTEMIVAPVRTTITLALSHKISEKVDARKVGGANDQEKKAKSPDSTEQNTYSINVHVDMSAINIFAQRVREMARGTFIIYLFNSSTFQVKLLHEHYLILSKMYCSMNPDEPPSKWQTAKLKPRLEVYTGSAQNYPAIKEFLELDPNFEAPQVKSGKKQILLII